MSNSPRGVNSRSSSQGASFATPNRRLTAEVLVKIFSWSVVIDPVRLAECRGLAGPVPSQNLGWLNVTHVCRNWRRLAVETPALWTRIHTTMGESWVEVFFTRSKNLPISFSNMHNPSVASDPYRLMANPILSEHIQRMRAITLLQPNNGPPHHDLFQPLPTLESLSLFAGYLMFDNAIFADVFQVSSLRHLCLLSPTNFTWHAPFINNLSTLCLANRSTPGHVEAGVFYEALRRMQQLERLCLEDLLPGMNNTTEMTIVALPNLRLLRLHGKCELVVGMLTRLLIGRIELDIACTNVDLNMASGGSVIEGLYRFLKQFNGAFDSDTAQMFKALSVIQCPELDRPWFSIHCERQDACHDWDPVWRSPNRVRFKGQALPPWEIDARFTGYANAPLTYSLDISIIFKKAERTVIRDAVDHILGQLPLQDVRLLRLDGQYTSAFCTPFSHVPRVRHLRTYPAAFAHCVANLREDGQDGIRSANEITEWSLPSLPPIEWASGSPLSKDPLCRQISDLAESRLAEGMEPIRVIYLQHPATHFQSLFKDDNGAWFGLPEVLQRLVKEELTGRAVL